MTVLFNTLGPFRDKIVMDLMQICPDPGMTFNLTTGQVSFAQTQEWTVGSELIADLSALSTRVYVRAAPPEFSFATGGTNSTIRDALGVCIPTGDRPSPTGAEIVYDGTECDGKGAWAAGVSTFSVGNPGYVILFHELVHADRMLHNEELYTDSTQLRVSPDEEDVVVTIENRFRATKFGLGARSVDAAASGGCNPPPKPPPKKTEKPSSFYAHAYTIPKCFVATAAYGSPMEPRVEFLRAFREGVLKQTRAGRQFFDDFYRPYYDVSPGIVALMEADPSVMETMRLAIVEPVVQHLQLANRFPEAPLDEVPEPWRSFLEDTRDALQAWIASIPLPYVMSDLPAEEAVAELAVVLRFLLRTPELRAAYLDRLTLLSEIPLRFDEADRGDLAAALARAGRPAVETERILGVEPS